VRPAWVANLGFASIGLQRPQWKRVEISSIHGNMAWKPLDSERFSGWDSVLRDHENTILSEISQDVVGFLS